MLFGVSAVDPVTYAAVAAALAATALLASFAPARRASLIDPVRALKME
jgi:ABC-type lipoprotein release transport system permease subunit